MPWIATDCLVVIAKEVLRLLVIAGRLVVVVCLRETSTGFEIGSGAVGDQDRAFDFLTVKIPCLVKPEAGRRTPRQAVVRVTISVGIFS